MLGESHSHKMTCQKCNLWSGKHFVRSSSRVWRKFLLMFSLSHSPLLIGNNSTECRGTALDVALPENWLKSVSNFVFPPLAFLLHISYTYDQMHGIHIFFYRQGLLSISPRISPTRACLLQVVSPPPSIEEKVEEFVKLSWTITRKTQQECYADCMYCFLSMPLSK